MNPAKRGGNSKIFALDPHFAFATRLLMPEERRVACDPRGETGAGQPLLVAGLNRAQR